MQSIKIKSFSLLQEKRRQESVERNRQRRDEQITKRRERLLWNTDSTSIPASFNNQIKDMDKQNKRKVEAIRDWSRRRQFSQSICIPEWMIEIPHDLTMNWVVLPRPEGKRHILTSKKGKTVIRSITGFSNVVKSNLPGGLLNIRGNCIFDVILSDSYVYVMDILYFNNVDYSESEAESRFFTLTSRLTEEEYYVIYNNKQLPIRTVPFYPCNLDILHSIYESSHTYILNGFLFVQKYSQIEEGSSPEQLLWKDEYTSQYVVDTDAEGNVRTVQEVTLLYRNGSLQCLEGMNLCDVSLSNIEEESLVRCSIDSVVTCSDGTWSLEGVDVRGSASLSKTLPDTISKIVFQQMARQNPLSINQIANSLLIHESFIVCLKKHSFLFHFIIISLDPTDYANIYNK